MKTAMQIGMAVVFCGLLSSCASYVTPGGPARLDAIDRADIASVAARKPAANFPARIGIIRVQAATYASESNPQRIGNRYSVLTTQELLDETRLQQIARWPGVTAAMPVGRLLLPEKLDSLDDLRLAAAKLQAGVLVIYTIDTEFHVRGRGYAPLSLISLGLVPDRDAHIAATASALFVDVRSGFTYGGAETTAQLGALTNVWGQRDTIDRKRLEAERQAFSRLCDEAAISWQGIVAQQQAMSMP